ncbi:amidohydrolase [Lacihabitans sp. LS3-19]|uniref:amidohydrolase family protein n=1 Tax=Lacihabitans sp. LS3-19 TaxID=2487335 RepID=UPI0020CE3753|nr:amidohydrolase family protein [Lacihabitans sp. LS3-19]MCP9766951.1 amidohydrolase [Lacihabitans sp. LS3-19]
MKIDAHQHFWNYNSTDFAWINDEMAKIQRSFLPEDLKPILDANQIDGTVLVQVNQTEEETLYINGLAEQNDFIKGVVGWTDLKSQTLKQSLEKFKEYPKIKGFRHIVQGEEIGFMRDPSFVSGIQTLSEYDYTYDILIYPTQMKDAIYLAKTCPNTHFVIDHLAKPYIKDQKISQWGNYIQKLSELPNVHCKVSGMVTEADWNSWKKEDFYIYLDIVLGSFGVDRIMYGSDWPVCLVAAEYSEQLNILKSYFEKLTTSEKDLIFGSNAIKFYKL